MTGKTLVGIQVIRKADNTGIIKPLSAGTSEPNPKCKDKKTNTNEAIKEKTKTTNVIKNEFKLNEIELIYY